jgi:hypothetical protein
MLKRGALEGSSCAFGFSSRDGPDATRDDADEERSVAGP